MNFFGYVDRQKQIIRNRHAGEEVLIVRGGNKVIRQGEGMFAAPDKDESTSFGNCIESKSVEQLLYELSQLKGLNTAERERFCAGTV